MVINKLRRLVDYWLGSLVVYGTVVSLLLFVGLPLVKLINDDKVQLIPTLHEVFMFIKLWLLLSFIIGTFYWIKVELLNLKEK
jgi:hypothetical protein